jgi:hypothetical protein
MLIPSLVLPMLLATLAPVYTGPTYYGTIEYADGRTLTGKIRATQLQDQLGLFVPKEGATRMIPLSDIRRLQFNWHQNPAGRQPYFLQMEGDIRVTLVTGEVVLGAYFGNAPGAREFVVMPDNMEQVALVLNDTKRTLGECIRSIDFQTVQAPEPPPAANASLTGRTEQADYEVKAETAELLIKPAGSAVATLHAGVRLRFLEQKGDWVKVKTIGLIEVTGWIYYGKLQAEKQYQYNPNQTPNP